MSDCTKTSHPEHTDEQRVLTEILAGILVSKNKHPSACGKVNTRTLKSQMLIFNYYRGRRNMVGYA